MQMRITQEGLQPYLSFLGTFVQLGGTLLMFALMLLLQRYARRRRFFRTWSQAWGVLAVALFAVVIRYNLLPSATPRFIEGEIATTLILFIYQFAKLAFYGLLIAGTLRFVRAAPSSSAVTGAVVFAALFSVV